MKSLLCEVVELICRNLEMAVHKAQVLQPILKENREAAVNRRAPLSLPGPQYGNLEEDDAFATIISWLYSRMDRSET